LVVSSLSKESLESLHKTIDDAAAKGRKWSLRSLDTGTIVVGTAPTEKDAFERAIIVGLGITRHGWGQGTKNLRDNKEKRQREFFKLYDSIEGQNGDKKGRIIDALEAFREHLKDAPGLKTPSRKTAYRWLRRRQKTAPLTTS
jgi:hypothetical protein